MDIEDREISPNLGWSIHQLFDGVEEKYNLKKIMSVSELRQIKLINIGI